jgi:hypothetical protein
MRSSFQWTLFSPCRSLTYESANVSQSSSSVIIPDNWTPLGTSQADFVLKPPSGSELLLVPGVVYTATLQGVAQGTSSFGAASIYFVINQPPQSGTCQACRCYLQDDACFSHFKWQRAPNLCVPSRLGTDSSGVCETSGTALVDTFRVILLTAFAIAQNTKFWASHMRRYRAVPGQTRISLSGNEHNYYTRMNVQDSE